MARFRDPKQNLPQDPSEGSSLCLRCESNAVNGYERMNEQGWFRYWNSKAAPQNQRSNISGLPVGDIYVASGNDMKVCMMWVTLKKMDAPTPRPALNHTTIHGVTPATYHIFSWKPINDWTFGPSVWRASWFLLQFLVPSTMKPIPHHYSRRCWKHDCFLPGFDNSFFAASWPFLSHWKINRLRGANPMKLNLL